MDNNQPMGPYRNFVFNRNHTSARTLVWITDDPKSTAEQCFADFARREHGGREYVRTPDGGYQFVDGVKVYRVEICMNQSRGIMWGVYEDKE